MSLEQYKDANRNELWEILQIQVERIAELEKNISMLEQYNGSVESIIQALEAHNLEQQLKILKEYANTCGVLRQEPSTRGLHELIMDLEAKALKVGK